jgi:hypothetical protein
MRTRRGVIACVFPMLALLLHVPGAAAQKSGGITPNTTTCGVTPDNPCLPHIYIDNVTLASSTQVPESGPFTYSFRVTNNGKATGTFSIQCLSIPSCLARTPRLPRSVSSRAGRAWSRPGTRREVSGRSPRPTPSASPAAPVWPTGIL